MPPCAESVFDDELYFTIASANTALGTRSCSVLSRPSKKSPALNLDVLHYITVVSYDKAHRLPSRDTGGSPSELPSSISRRTPLITGKNSSHSALELMKSGAL